MSTLKGYAILAALAIPGLAFAASESESNHPIGLANTLTVSDDGSATVDGVIGVNSGTPQLDLDFYTFNGKAGDVVTIDIDGGIGGARSVDTWVGIFESVPPYQMLRNNDDSPLDPGSIRLPAGQPSPSNTTWTYDARIIDFKLPKTGSYIVGVSAIPRRILTGGGASSNSLTSTTGFVNGDYTLSISGVSPALLLINLDIKPGSTGDAPINPKSKGKVPVALLGASDFTVHDVNASKLTFGHSGDEASYVKCGEPSDVNGDAFPDMVCHFENQLAQFTEADDEAILRGELDDGTRFEGRGWLKVVPVKE